MRFKTDENLPVEAAATLRDAGFDAVTVWDQNLSGAADQVLAATVQKEGRILLTLDLDFANIQAYPPRDHAGIVVLRLKSQDKPTVISYVQRLAAALAFRNPTGELWIVEATRIRFRSWS